MAQGLLEITGTLDVAQFWPSGKSDADTTKIVLAIGPNAFRFRPTANAAFQSTQAFVGAKVRAPGQGPKDVIVKGKVTIRLQGIDAPELHYRPPSALKPAQRSPQQTKRYKELNEEYRQPLAETGTKALRDHLFPHGPQLPCRMVTAVDEPGDVVDIYGRCVGDILVTIHGQNLNLNHWLVEQGWAFPTFYSSMSKQEITDLLQLSTSVRTRKDGVWKHWKKQNKVDAVNLKLIYRSKAAMPDPQEENGPVIMPKLFRRGSTWKINQMAKMVTGGFGRYLAAHPDDCYMTSQFLVSPHTAAHRKLHEFHKAEGTFSVRPDELVFQEKDATLVGHDGMPVTDW